MEILKSPPIARFIGSWCWAAIVPIMIVGHGGAQWRWQIPYSWNHHMISDLGAVSCGLQESRRVCSPWHAFANASFVVVGVLLVVGQVLLSRCGRSVFRSRPAAGSVLVAGTGFVFAGIFPEDVNLNLHVIAGAAPLFFGSISACLIAAFDGGLSTPRRRVLALIGLAALIGTVLMFAKATTPLGLGGIERIVVYPFFLACGLFGFGERQQRLPRP